MEIQRVEVDGRMTFIVDGRPKCWAKHTQDDGRCKNPAGHGTPHVGSGRCRKHGGNAGRPIVRPGSDRAVMTVKDTQKILSEFRSNQAELASTDNEIAILKTMTDHYIGEWLVSKGDEDYEKVVTSANVTGKLVDRKRALEVGMPIPKVQYLMQEAVEVIKSIIYDCYGDDAEEHFVEAMRKWRGKMAKYEQVLLE